MIGLQLRQARFGDVDARAAVLLAELGEEFFDEQRYIFFAIAQRRNEKRDDVEAIEEVFAEVAAADFLFEVFVGGGDDTRVDMWTGRAGADGVEALLI